MDTLAIHVEGAATLPVECPLSLCCHQREDIVLRIRGGEAVAEDHHLVLGAIVEAGSPPLLHKPLAVLPLDLSLLLHYISEEAPVPNGMG